MRILIISNLYPPNVIGGYERLCFAVASRLAAEGHDITVLTSHYGGAVADYPGQTILRDLKLLTGSDVYAPFAGTAEDRAAINLANLDRLRGVIGAVRPDVIYAWNLFFLDGSMLDALEASGVPCALMLTDNWLLVMRNPAFVRDYFADVVHGTKKFAPPPQPPAWRRALSALRGRRGRPAGLAAIFSSAFMRDLYAEGGCGFARSRIVHHGVRLDPDPPVVADRSTLIEPGKLRLLFAGRLVDLKGAHTTVEALGLLDPAALGVTGIQLTLLGDEQDKAYMATLRDVIAQSGRSKDIVLQPSIPESALPQLFNEHDIYLFPSLYEPFSLTLIHALGLGIPTIASDAGGNVEIVSDGKSGLLFPKGDAAKLAACIMRLAKDGRLRVRLSSGGRRIAAQFTFERMVEEMTSFLVELR